MNALIDLVIEKRLTYLTADKLSFLMRTVEALNEKCVPGNLAEFGIALGGSAICIASKLTDRRLFLGFDNFDVIPSPALADGPRSNARYDIIKSGRSAGIGGDLYYGYEKDRLSVVIRNFHEFGLPVDGQRIALIKGVFEETLPRSLCVPVAFAHVDCDWYSPVRLCLERIYPLLSTGGAVVVDDYNQWEGCTKATNEFCDTHTDIALTAGITSALLVKRSG